MADKFEKNVLKFTAKKKKITSKNLKIKKIQLQEFGEKKTWKNKKKSLHTN